MSKLDEAYEKAMNECPSNEAPMMQVGCDNDEYYLCTIHQDPQVIAEKVARSLLEWAKEYQEKVYNADEGDTVTYIQIEKLEEFFK